VLSFLLAPSRLHTPLPLTLYSIGCHEQTYILRPDGFPSSQLFWTRRGKGCFHLLNGRKLYLEEGQAMLLPVGFPHEYYALQGEPWVLAFLGYNGTAAEAVTEGCGLPFCRPFGLRNPNALWSELEHLWHKVNSGAPGMELHYSRQVYSLLLAAGGQALVQPENTKVREPSSSDKTGAVSPSPDGEALILPPHSPSALPGAVRTVHPGAMSSADTSLRQTLQFMQEHYTEQLSMANLAGAVGYSVQHFQRIFKKTYGVTPHTYLQRIRLHRSLEWLLERPVLSIKEIAGRLGWEANYYIRVFRSEFGMPPGQYRRSHTIGRDQPEPPFSREQRD
jgi:AraC family transcriptional regulator